MRVPFKAGLFYIFFGVKENLVHTIRVGDIEMEYARIGTGPKPLIVIPGLSIKSVMNSAASLEVPYKVFKEDYTLYFFDRKKNIAPGYSLRQMADDQAAAMLALGIENAAVFGVSQGGMVAQYLAIHYPQLVGKLVLGSSSSKPEPMQLKVIGNWARLAEAHDSRGLVDSFIEKCFSEKFLARYRRPLLAMYAEVSDEEMDRFAILAHACDEVDIVEQLSKIQCPVLVLGAGDDRVLSAEASVKIVDKLKNSGVRCEFYMYEGYGHAVFDELREYKDRIYAFLQG